MPRAAMSVATSTGTEPARKPASARSRCGWLLLPWIAAAAMPALSRPRTTLSAPCLVRVKTSTRSIAGSLQERLEQRLLAAGLHEDHALLDALGGGRDRGDRDLGRVGQERVGQLAIAFGMVAEKNRVWRSFGSSVDDALQRMDEAEVEHLVGLVEDEDLDLAQAQRALVDEVEQAAGRGDEHVDAAGDSRAPLGGRW